MRAIKALYVDFYTFNNLRLLYKFILNLETVGLCTIIYPLILMIYTLEMLMSFDSVSGTVPLSLWGLLELEEFTISDDKVIFKGS